MTDTEPVPDTADHSAAAVPAPATAAEAPAQPRRKPQRPPDGERHAAAQRSAKAPTPNLALLEQLAALYPALFGAVFLPMKRGIYQDLLAAHPDVFEREALKLALGFHTRSTRYLTAVASGLQRHDLLGQPVEAMAPEHVHHALLEVFRRRQGRSAEDLNPKLRERMVLAFEASGLTREAYAERVRGRDVAANTLLDEALAEAASRAAKDEALLRAFEVSGQTLEAFADMYGMNPRAAARTLERAERRRVVAATEEAPATTAAEDGDGRDPAQGPAD